MIEVVSAERCISCDVCVTVCPTNVFERGPDGLPMIARQSDCQTCFMCEAYCPVDALFVHPSTSPAEPTELRSDLTGSYREEIGWGHGRQPGAQRAIDLVFHSSAPPPSTSQP